MAAWSLLLTCGIIPLRAAEQDGVLRLRDRATISRQEFYRELAGIPVIYVGENHDNPAHHLAQLQIISALQEKGIPLAIAAEMFLTGDQPMLDQWVAGAIDEEQFGRFFQERWRISWGLYRDIFRYARQQRIPIIGINIPREIVRKVAASGFGSLTAAERKELPADVTCIIDPAYKGFIHKIFSTHQGERSFDYFCEAQMLWTKGMARNLAVYRSRNPKRTIVVLTGIGHALRPGIPTYFHDLDPEPYRIVSPELVDLNRENATTSDLDYLLLDQ